MLNRFTIKAETIQSPFKFVIFVLNLMLVTLFYSP